MPRTPSGVPSVAPRGAQRPDSNAPVRRADNVSRTARPAPAPDAERPARTSVPRVIERATPTAPSRNAVSIDGTRTGDGRGITSRSTVTDQYSQRSGLTRFGGTTGSSTFRGDSSTPQRSLPTSTYTSSKYYGGYSGSYYGNYYGGYYGGYYAQPYSSVSFNWYLGGGWSIGFSSGWYANWGWYRPVYYGSFATAWLVGNAWTIMPHHGFWGWYGGGRCYWLPYHSWRGHNTFYYRGVYCRVYRPYWYSYSHWWDYRPYRYGYTTIVYDDLYDRGYERGYNRGYVEGAEDASEIRDDRKRDSIGRPRVPDSSADRARGNTATEYRYEMSRGTEAVTKGDYAAATKAFKEAAILDPNSSDARYMLAVSALGEGKFAFAAFGLRRAVNLDPEGSNLDLVAIYGSHEVVAELRSGLNQAAEREPGNADIQLMRGYLALRVGDYRVAAESLDRALQLSPQDSAARHLHSEAMKGLEGE